MPFSHAPKNTPPLLPSHTATPEHALENSLLRGLREGLMVLLPLLTTAALALLITNFPLDLYQVFMPKFFGPNWKQPVLLVYTAAVRLVALHVTYTVGESLVRGFNEKRPDLQIHPTLGALVALSSFAILAWGHLLVEYKPLGQGELGITMPWTGLEGMLGAILCALFSVSLFLGLCRVNFLRFDLQADGATPLTPHLFQALLPTIITLCIVICTHYALVQAGWENIHAVLYDVMRMPLKDMGHSLGEGLLYGFLTTLYWFFGVNGTMALGPLMEVYFQDILKANMAAVNQGLAAPHMLTQGFFDGYLNMGGTGSTLCLILAITLWSKDTSLRRISTLSLLPGIFNINELLMFGLPIVFNPIYMIPFMGVPLLGFALAYGASALELVPPPAFDVAWTMPPLLSGWLLTASWKGAALQALILSLGTMFYLPFVRMADKRRGAIRSLLFQQLTKMVMSNKTLFFNTGSPASPNAAGMLMRSLTKDLCKALVQDIGGVTLYYQPRVNVVEKTVPTVEALLRWDHPEYGAVPPPLLLAIAAEAGITDTLNSFVLQKALIQQQQWRAQGMSTVISLNLSNAQLADPAFPTTLMAQFTEHGLPPNCLQLEVGELTALGDNEQYLAALQALHHTGVLLAIDDFGYAYQAFLRLKQLPFAERHIGRNLVHNLAERTLSQEVIATIQGVSQDKGIPVVAEQVESHQEMETLLELNISSFQGHIFSEPLPADACAEFIQKFRLNV